MLFLRLPENDSLGILSAYAPQSLLKANLGSDGQLLSNTLITKIGLALCPIIRKTINPSRKNCFYKHAQRQSNWKDLSMEALSHIKRAS